MSKLKILLTGGNGFIGRNIKESFLKESYELVAPSKVELDLIDDESVKSYFLKKSFDAVIHAAAMPSHRNAIITNDIIASNSRMFFNLLQHQNNWGKLLLIGSGGCYDLENYQPKMQESYFGTHIPKDAHGYTKYIIGQLLPSLKNIYDLRVFGIYGKYEDYTIRFISNAICKTLFNLPITLRQDKLFDYIYIDDLMPILTHFIENTPKEKAFNITPDTSQSLAEIAKAVNLYAGNKSEIKIANAGQGLHYSGCNLRLRSEMPNLKFTTIEEGVFRLYQWYSDNQNLIDKNKLLLDK